MNERRTTSKAEIKPTLYRSYLLRLWRPEGSVAGGCRASMEDPDTGKRLGFASMDELLIFLIELSENEGEGEAIDPTNHQCQRTGQ